MPSGWGRDWGRNFGRQSSSDAHAAGGGRLFGSVPNTAGTSSFAAPCWRHCSGVRVFGAAGFPDRKHQAAHRFTILFRQATVVVDQALFFSIELSGPQGCTDGGT